MAVRDYDAYRERQAQISRERSEEGRDIGELPKVKNRRRRDRCARDLERFCLTYFPHRFWLPFSDMHREAMRRLEECTACGGQFVCAMPRGSGKDTIAECEVLRALLYGLRHYVVFVAATQQLAARSLKKIRGELETNDLLLQDFPAAVYPIRCLDRNPLRARMQTYRQEFTRIEWTAESLVLPTIPGAPSSGGAVHVAGLTGALRGLTIMGPDHEVRRPDMVIISDPQTREAAKSPTQTTDREAIITDDVLMLAGPTTKIAATQLCTVVYKNDLSDRFLDPERHPDWKAVRTRMVEKFPADMELWDQYAEIRRSGLRDGDDGKAGTEFYLANRKAMDAGAVLSWPERVKDGDVSGLQSAMNVYYDNPRGFHAELQNDPQADALAEGAKELTADSIVGRLSGLERYVVPRETSRLTAFVDPGLTLLWYAVVAWTERGSGSVIDYGCWPRQSRTWFEARDARPSLKDQHPGYTDPQLVFAGLQALVPEILTHKYTREGGGEQPVDRLLIDCGWLPDAVFQFARQHGGPVYPSKGIGRTMTSRGVSEWTKRPGERTGYHWRLTVPEAGRVRMVQFDPDAWKSRVHELLTTPLGGVRTLTLFGKAGSDEERRRSAAVHEMIANHLAAEYSTPVTIRGNTFDKWEVRPERPDNHLLDTVVGAAVAAGVSGVEWVATPTGEPVARPAKKAKLSYAGQRAKLDAMRVGTR